MHEGFSWHRHDIKRKILTDRINLIIEDIARIHQDIEIEEGMIDYHVSSELAFNLTEYSHILNN
jgi:hypothetical protein